jgi:hypothetical protein
MATLVPPDRRSLRGAAFKIAAVTLLAGCNALFGIRDGHSRPSCLDELMIDDMEDGDAEICSAGMRHGKWFVVLDGSASGSPAPARPFTPAIIPGGRDGSGYAAHVTGSAAGGWDAVMGFNLNVQGLENKPYNVSAAGGIRFWMKTTGPIVVPRVAVRFPVSSTLPPTEGGTCLDTADSRNCNNHFQYVISPHNPGEWVEYMVPFTALTQETQSDAAGRLIVSTASWNAEIVGVQFAAHLDLGSEVWVDDIRFDDCVGANCRLTCDDPGKPFPCPGGGGVPARCSPAEASCDSVPSLKLTGIWASEPYDVWTVGFSTAKRPPGIIARSQGFSTIDVTVNPDAEARALAGVWGSGWNDVWAVGDWGALVHWDGRTLAPVSSPTTKRLTSVWGSAPNDVWAVGIGAILHWDGAIWSIAPAPIFPVVDGIWGSAANDVWAVSDDGPILHWNGAEWSEVAYDQYQSLYGVWGSGRNDVWAVGQTILRWNGSSWQRVADPMNPSYPYVVILNSVWGSGADDVWAVGSGGTIMHWDGTIWRLSPSGTTGNLNRVWGTSRDRAWAVGDGTFVQWDGAAWSSGPSP